MSEDPEPSTSRSDVTVLIVIALVVVAAFVTMAVLIASM